MLQEHNVKNLKKIEYFNQFYHLILNKSILSKGGTLIAINKKLNSTIGSTYLHPTSRLTTAYLNIFNTKLYLVNVYAPSGKSKDKEREEFFEQELMQSLVTNTDNILLAGDWNCILSPRDSSRPENTSISKNMKGIISNLNFKDIISAKKSNPDYTYYKEGYGARLDRIYVSKLFPNIYTTATKPAYFSDHLSVIMELNVSSQVKVGRPQWRLNVSILKDELVKANMGTIWSHLQRKKSSFTNIICWWEELAKPTLKSFYIQQGKEKKKYQMGLINYLEINLRKQYEIANQTGVTNFEEIKSIKQDIDSYRQHIALGIKVRSRVQDSLANETISKYLIAKQKDISQKKIIHAINDNNGVNLTAFDDIQEHIVNFYKNLYSKRNSDTEKQNYFLSFLSNELSDADREFLSSPLSIPEVKKIIKDMAENKTPGNDGFPVEFYDENFEIICDDLLTMLTAVLDTGRLSKSQRRAIIILIPKCNNTTSIDNYRPISLLCVDYKILSKVLSERMKKVLHKVIHSKQFCSVPGRSINHCNMELRDIFHFANDLDLELAVVNLDWYKAFDLVSIEFTLKALRKLGFGDTFVNWVSILYNDIESSIQINNILSDFFPVTSSVRQGCPLSMGLFVVYQEAFYRAFVKSQIIRPLRMPDSSETLLIGYADDTNIFITSERSLIEVDRIISHFEKATGAVLNRNNKTKIYGIGKWKGREQWPLIWLKVETDHFFTLGIYHCNSYAGSIEKNWSKCVSAIKSHRQILSNRNLTLFQRCTYTNACMLSKIWYVAHIYPLPRNYAKEINKIIFHYIWNGSYEPVRRSTLCRSKKDGGVGVIDCLIKSQVLLLNSFIKCNIHEDYHNPLMYYYCYTRMHNILEMQYSIHNASLITTPYYEIIYGLIQKVIHVPGFPIVSNKKLYNFILPNDNSYAEINYPTFNWKLIWKNFRSIIFNPYEKEIIFKHLHLCLATNQRLAMMRQPTTALCNNCSGNFEHTPIHIFYQCENINPIFLWMLRVLHNICNFKPKSNIRFLYFDTTYENLFQKHICNIFLYIYIITIWKTRKENLRIGILKHMIIRSMTRHLKFIENIPNHKMEEILEKISRLDFNNFINI